MAEALQSLSFFIEQFDNQLTCNICLDQYTDPKILPCYHSFCLECIQLIPTAIKNAKYYIKCPTCRIEHLTPEGGAANLPNDFKINTLLDLQKKLVVTDSPLITCPIHKDPLKVYCETCCQVICRDCAVSKKHKTHNWHLISEDFDKHCQQIETNLETIKNKMADLITAVAQIDINEREVIEKEEQLQDQINAHAQQIIDQAQRSREQLSQQLHNIVKQKTQLLAAQKQLAQQLHTQLNTCHETIEHNLEEWTQLQILTKKHTMINQMNTTTQHVDRTVFKSIENTDIRFTKTDLTKNGIGFITSTTHGNTTLVVSPCSAKNPTKAILNIQSQDGSPFSLAPTLISSTLSSGDAHSVKSNITQQPRQPVESNITQQTCQPRKYNIKFTPFTPLANRVCPICSIQYPAMMQQQDFERHVNSHF